MDAIKIRGARRVINAAAQNFAEVEKPIAAELHGQARVGEKFFLAEEDAADVRDNIFHAETLGDELGGGHRKTFLPVEVRQVGEVLFARKNFLVVLNEIRAAEGELNCIVGEGGHQL